MPTPHKHELGVHYIKGRSKWSGCLRGPSPLNGMGSGWKWLWSDMEAGEEQGAGQTWKVQRKSVFRHGCFSEAEYLCNFMLP